METIPERRSLVAQTAQIIRGMINDGEWETHLPTEAQLQERMQVGRNTVRAALALMEKEGWISAGRPGLRRRILKQGQPMPASRTRLVAFLAPDVLERARSQVVLTVGGLRDHLAEIGYRLEIHTSKAFRLDHPGKTLETLVRKSPADLWVLHLSSREIQEWFADSGIPCLVYGSTQEGIDLPCVDIDFAAITRHAVGHLLGKGHARITLLLPDKRLYGDLQGEAAFREAMQLDQYPDRQGTVIRVGSNDPEAVCRELRRVARRADRPTGLILWRVRYAFAALSYLPSLGLRVPEDLSVICTDDSSSAEWLVPPLARYHVKQTTLISKLFRHIHEILTAGPGRATRDVILPDWFPGGSVAPPPAA